MILAPVPVRTSPVIIDIGYPNTFSRRAGQRVCGAMETTR
jgi:hypothetical protein